MVFPYALSLSFSMYCYYYRCLLVIQEGLNWQHMYTSLLISVYSFITFLYIVSSCFPFGTTDITDMDNWYYWYGFIVDNQTCVILFNNQILGSPSDILIMSIYISCFLHLIKPFHYLKLRWWIFELQVASLDMTLPLGRVLLLIGSEPEEVHFSFFCIRKIFGHSSTSSF